MNKGIYFLSLSGNNRPKNRNKFSLQRLLVPFSPSSNIKFVFHLSGGSVLLGPLG